MTARGVEDEARKSAGRLIDLIQTAVLHYPHIIIAIEQTARAFVAEERRRDLTARLRNLDPQQIAELEALITQMERRGEPIEDE